MASAIRTLGVITLVLTLAGTSVAGDEPLPKEEIARRGKAATGLVVVRNGLQVNQGSAFCIHPSGLFLTNDHLLRRPLGLGLNPTIGPEVQEITLVLNPSEKGEKVCKAKLVRSDKELDLALLRVEGVKDLPALALGSDAKLSELAEVVAVGFPFGTVLAMSRREYPAVSINPGSITSLRRRDDRLHRIQLGVLLNRGNSGGPVLDATGKVVGIVATGIEGSGVNFAIPVSIVSEFVAKPDIEFEPPTLSAVNIHQAVVFEARVRPIVPTSDPITVDLILKPTGGTERTFRMEPAGDTFRVTAVPVPPVAGALPLRLVARFDNGSLNATAADQTVSVADQTIKLSDIHSIQLQPKSRVMLRNGKPIEGPVSRLDAVAVQLGEQSLSVDLSKSMEVKIGPAVATDQVWYTLVVRQGEQEILRLSESMTVQGGLAAATGIDGPTNIRPPALATPKVVYKLAAPVTNVVVGGGGRYLVLHLAKANKLAVFDVSAAEVVGHIPFGEPDAMFAAGQDHVFVVLPHSGKIERWRFQGLERDAEATLPIKGTIKSVTMGAASRGPLLVHSVEDTELLPRATFALVDGDTLKALRTNIKPDFMLGALHGSVHIRAAANGKVFGMWASNRSPSGLGLLAVTDSDEKMSFDMMSTGHVVPSPDGKVLFTMKGQRAPEFGQPDVMMMSKADDPMLPACHGNYYIHLPAGSNVWTVIIRAPGRAAPVATLSNVDLPEFKSRPIALPMQDRNTASTDFTPDKRVHLVPSARLLVVIPTSNDRLVLHQYGE
jgi:hypothetical protein